MIAIQRTVLPFTNSYLHQDVAVFIFSVSALINQRTYTDDQATVQYVRPRLQFHHVADYYRDSVRGFLGKLGILSGGTITKTIYGGRSTPFRAR